MVQVCVWQLILALSIKSWNVKSMTIAINFKPPIINALSNNCRSQLSPETRSATTVNTCEDLFFFCNWPMVTIVWPDVDSNSLSQKPHAGCPTSTIHKDMFSMQYRITGANSMRFPRKGDILPPSSRCSLMLEQPMMANAMTQTSGDIGHVISTFQQGHQAFPLVKLKDSGSNTLGHAYHFLSPMVPIHFDHTFNQTPNLHLHTVLIHDLNKKPSTSRVFEAQSTKHEVINMGRYSFYNESPNEYCFMEMKILVWALMCLSLISTISTMTRRSYRDLLTPLWQMVISSLTSSHQHHKDGAVTSSVVLLPYVMMKCPSPTLIWLLMQPTWKQSSIVQFTLFDYGERLIHHIGSTWHASCGIICFTFYTLFCKGLEMMGSDKICTTSHTYVHVLSLCHLYPLLVTWKITNENFQNILFSCNCFFSQLYLHLAMRNELRYHCCLSQATEFHRALQYVPIKR